MVIDEIVYKVSHLIFYNSNCTVICLGYSTKLVFIIICPRIHECIEVFHL